MFTALLKCFVTVLLRKIQNAQAHTVGLNLIRSGFEDCADNGFCILTDKLSFLDKVRTIPLGKAFIVVR